MVLAGISSSLFSSLVQQSRTERAIAEQSAIVASGLRVNTADDDIGAFVRNIDLTIDSDYLQTTQTQLATGKAKIEAGISALTELITHFNSELTLAASVAGTGMTAVGTATQAAFTALTAQRVSFIGLGTVDGTNILGAVGTASNLVLNNVIGGGIAATLDITLTGRNVSTTLGTVTAIATASNATTAVGEITADIVVAETALAQLGATLDLIDATIAVNGEVQTSIQTAATSIVEADDDVESALLTALQTQSDVGLTVLGIVSAGQRSILALFQWVSL